jgi:hypothetical protein
MKIGANSIVSSCFLLLPIWVALISGGFSYSYAYSIPRLAVIVDGKTTGPSICVFPSPYGGNIMRNPNGKWALLPTSVKHFGSSNNFHRYYHYINSFPEGE